MGKNLLNRAKLLEKEKLEVEKVELGNDEFVYVKQMTGRERDNFEQSLLKKNRDTKGQVVGYEQATEDFRAKLAVVTLCDETGKLLLEPRDYSILSQNMSAARLEKIVNAAQKLNAISEQDKDDLVKNSSPEPEDNSNSGSVEN
jgi:hypothetical protein